MSNYYSWLENEARFQLSIGTQSIPSRISSGILVRVRVCDDFPYYIWYTGIEVGCNRHNLVTGSDRQPNLEGISVLYSGLSHPRYTAVLVNWMSGLRVYSGEVSNDCLLIRPTLCAFFVLVQLQRHPWTGQKSKISGSLVVNLPLVLGCIICVVAYEQEVNHTIFQRLINHPLSKACSRLAFACDLSHISMMNPWAKDIHKATQQSIAKQVPYKIPSVSITKTTPCNNILLHRFASASGELMEIGTCSMICCYAILGPWRQARGVYQVSRNVTTTALTISTSQRSLD